MASPSPPVVLPSPLGLACAWTSGVEGTPPGPRALERPRASGKGTVWWEERDLPEGPAPGKQVALEGPGLGSEASGGTSRPRILSAPRPALGQTGAAAADTSHMCGWREGAGCQRAVGRRGPQSWGSGWEHGALRALGGRLPFLGGSVSWGRGARGRPRRADVPAAHTVFRISDAEMTPSESPGSLELLTGDHAQVSPEMRQHVGETARFKNIRTEEAKSGQMPKHIFRNVKSWKLRHEDLWSF